MNWKLREAKHSKRHLIVYGRTDEFGYEYDLSSIPEYNHHVVRLALNKHAGSLLSLNNELFKLIGLEALIEAFEILSMSGVKLSQTKKSTWTIPVYKIDKLPNDVDNQSVVKREYKKLGLKIANYLLEHLKHNNTILFQGLYLDDSNYIGVASMPVAEDWDTRKT